MNWKQHIEKESQVFAIPSNWLKIHYYEALNLLFRIENSLRIFVYTILKTEIADKWTEIAIQEYGKSLGTINSISKMRIQQEMSMGYISYQINCPIMQLTSGELVNLILDDSYWKYFNKYFSGNKEVIRFKLNEIVTVRNALSHFRPIKEDDIELVKQNAKHLFLNIEKYFKSMVEINKIVPSNCEEQWFTEMRKIISDLCQLSIYESEDETWIRLKISFPCEHLAAKREENIINFKVMNLISPNILVLIEELKEIVIYFTEDVPYMGIANETNPQFFKYVNIVVNRKSLKDNHTVFSKNISKLLGDIEKEVMMIREDPNAQGKLIKTAIVQLRNTGKYWSVNTNKLRCEVKENDPYEYWGDIYLSGNAIISEMSKYPWMPVDIANDDIPF